MSKLKNEEQKYEILSKNYNDLQKQIEKMISENEDLTKQIEITSLESNKQIYNAEN